MNQQPTTNNEQAKLKVCGLTDLNQIFILCQLGVDFLGFIFYEKSPRYVMNHLSLKDIAEIPHFGKVGVFVNESIIKIIEIAIEAQLNYIQLHGDEHPDLISELRQNLNKSVGIIKVIRIGNQSAVELQHTINLQSETVDYFLFDTDSNSFGGTGKSFDWDILNQIEIPIPYILSGGISSENIQQLTSIQNHPFALDINSKFEIAPGVKDLEKIKDFAESYLK